METSIFFTSLDLVIRKRRVNTPYVESTSSVSHEPDIQANKSNLYEYVYEYLYTNVCIWI